MDRSRELWRQCVNWLVETGVLPRQHKTTYRDAQVFDLAQTLRDGVVLCNLLNVITPGAVDLSQINIRPQMLQFLCVQNLRTVIASLHHVFGIPSHELFVAEDLYNMTNFRKVLKVLSLLSCSPLSSKKFRPFHTDPGPQWSSYRAEEEEEEDIYRNLPDLASERELVDEEDNLYDSVAIEEEKEEDIYGSVVGSKRSSSSSTAPKEKRTFCVDEIYETERNYVQHLEMMLHKFIEPLKGALDEKDIRIIFSNVDQLVPVHQDFLKAVEAERSDNMMRMSRPFLKYKDSFLKYGVYCSNLQDALSYLADLWKEDRIRESIESCQNKASHNKFKLRELLCVSMQRVLKYHLLVKELNKHTNDSHPDKADLGKALEAMKELSHYVNEVKRDSEMLTTISKVESCMANYSTQIPLSCYGRLLKDGDLRVKSIGDNKSKPRFTYLFDQALFLTSLKNEKYKLKDLCRLEDYVLHDTPQGKASKWDWKWTLKDKHGSQSFTFCAKTANDKMRWVESIKAAFESISPSSLKGKQHSFKMMSFKEPTYCFSCNKLLLGGFFQGYVCEQTGKAAHKLCLADALKKIDNVSNESPPPVLSRPHGSPSVHHGRQSSAPAPVSPSSTIGTNLYKAHRDYNGNPPPPFNGAPFITFCIGEQIQVDDKLTADWWMGKSLSHFDVKGYFPASCVSPMSSRAGNKSNYLATSITTLPKTGNDRAVPLRPTATSTALEDNVWYAGVLDRDGAAKLLGDKPSGSFLVRSRDGNLAISLNYKNDIKHIRILQSQNMYFVAESKNFKSVQELIRYYQENLMSTSFLGLETTLKIPYRDPKFFPGVPAPNKPNTQNHRKSVPALPPSRPSKPVNRNQTFSHGHSPMHGMNGMTITVNGRSYDIQGRARVLYDFDPRSTQELGLRTNQTVNVISKAGDDHGWWKGELEGKIGYFPASFIQEIG